jgi:Ca-activated chloride channel homolog
MLFSDFHFLRPYWLVAIIPVAFLIWKLAKQHLINKHWESVCDPELLPYILVGESGTKKHTHIILISLVTLLIIFALAGPTWERLPQPIFKKESALIVALDLSLSMYADDIKPSRLERARFKISDLLDLRQEGQTALIVYAADAYTVTPLTDDIKTIKSQLSALSPAIMPAPGSRTDHAIEESVELLQQAAISQGHILLVTDEVDSQYEPSIIEAKDKGYSVSILGIGTKEGAPINLGNSGFLEDRSGNIVIPKLNETDLRLLADSGGGYYETSQIADGDIERLNRLFNSGLDSNEETKSDLKTDQWHEFGPWLVLLILPVIALGFRRGYLVILVSVLVSSPDQALAFDWSDLWLNKNQKAMQALENEQADAASELFENKEWKAAAKYRAGDFAAAEEIMNELQGIQNNYNKANTLAKQGQYEEAIKIYDEVLKMNPEHVDAKYNKDIVEKELEKQKQQQSQSDQNQNNNQEQNSEENKEDQSGQEQQDSQSENQQQQSESGKESESEEQSASEEELQNEENKSAEQKKAVEDELKKQREQEFEQQQAEESEKESDEDKQEQKQNQQAMNELDEEQQAAEQWLRRIPDDPSGLLRRKFKYQYQKQRRHTTNNDQYW